MGWCVCIHNCVASCWAPIQGSILYPQDVHEGGEVFCYADTIDGNCRPAKNLKMGPPVCVRTSSLYAHTSSGRESRRVLLDRFVTIATGNRRSRGRPSVLPWVEKKTDKYTSSDIQNECLQIMALSILQGGLYAVMVLRASLTTRRH